MSITSDIVDTPITRTALREILTTALYAGRLMLENGANTARVEETVHRLGTALGADWMEVVVSPNAIIASAVAQDEHRTMVQRVGVGGVDLSRIADVLDVSRAAAAGRMDLPQVRHALDGIQRQPRRYSTAITTVAVAIAGAAIVALFGGGLAECLATLGCTLIAQMLRNQLHHFGLSRLLITALVAAAASGLALAVCTIAARFGLPIDPTLTLVGAVLLLVPGVPLVSSTADLFRGDITAGLARFTSAVLIVAMISIGVWAVLLIAGTEITIALRAPPPLVYAALLAALAAAGFGILFDVPPRSLAAAAFTGGAAYAVRLILVTFGAPAEVGSFAAGLTIGLLAELFARLLHQPTSLFAIPGFIPLVPGVVAFRAVLAFVTERYADGVADAVRAILLIGAIATGLGVIATLSRLRRPRVFA